MPSEVVSVTLEANISARTTSAFKSFERLVKNVGKSTLLFRKHTNSINTSIGRLNTSLNKKSGFTSFDRKLVSSTAKTKTLRKEVKLLRDNVNKLSDAFQRFAKSTSTPLSQANSNLQQVRRSAVKTAIAYRMAQTRLSGLQRQAGRAVNGVRMPNVNFYGGGGGGGGRNGNSHPMHGGFGPRGNISPVRLLQAGGSAAILGGAVTMAGRSILGMTSNLLTAGTEFEAALSRLASRLDSSEKYMLPSFREAAKTQARLFAKLPDEITASFEEMLAMGIKPKDIIGGAGRAVNAFASAGGFDASTSAQGIGLILSSLTKRNADGSVNFGEAGRVSDVLVGVGAATQANEREMIQAFKYASGGLSAGRLGYDMGALLIGAQSDIGRKGTAGGREVSEIVGRVVGQADKIKKELGVDVTFNSKGELEILEILEQIKPRLDEIRRGDAVKAASLEREIFGEQGQRAYLGITQGMKKIRALQKEIENGSYSGMAEKKALEATQNFKSNLERVKGAWQGLSEAFLRTNRGPLTLITNKLADMLTFLTKFVDQHPILSQAFVMGAASVGLMTIGVGALLTTLGFVSFTLGGIASSIQLLQLAVGGTRLFGKFGILTRGLVAGRNAVKGMVTAFPMLGRVGAVVGRVFGGTAARFVGLRAALLGIGGLTGPVGWALTALSLVVWKLWNPIKAFFGGLYDGFFSVLTPAITDFRAALTEVWDAAQPGIDLLWKLLMPSELTKEEFSGIAKIGHIVGQVLAKTVIPAIRAVTKVLQFSAETGQYFRDKWTALTDYLKASPIGAIFKSVSDTFTFSFEKVGSVLDWVTMKFDLLSDKLDSYLSKLRLLNPFNILSNSGDYFGSSKEKEESKLDSKHYFKKSVRDSFVEARSKLIVENAISKNDNAPDRIKDGAMESLQERKILTVRDLLALRQGNEFAPDYQKIEFTPEQKQAIDQVQKMVEAMPMGTAKEYAARESVLNSSPTVNITINGNVGNAQEIGEEVSKAIDKSMWKVYRDQRENYTDDMAF